MSFLSCSHEKAFKYHFITVMTFALFHILPNLALLTFESNYVTEFIGLNAKQSLSRERTAIIVVLAIYCVSLLQFVVITTSTTYEYSENEKEMVCANYA